jgi:hypothetical protein
MSPALLVGDDYGYFPSTMSELGSRAIIHNTAIKFNLYVDTLYGPTQLCLRCFYYNVPFIF